MTGKTYVTIKGTKEGLVFLLDDQCEFVDLLDELNAKLDKHVQQFTGPIVHIFIKLGARHLEEEDKERIRAILRRQGNLLIQSIESDPPAADPVEIPGTSLHTMTGIVRSGQTLEYSGHLLLLGDVNPGGTIRCTGDVYILGALRGAVHAGIDGDVDAIIAASLMKPTQLRIAEIISRPPDEWTSAEPWMEYAFLRDGTMAIDKMTSLSRQRKEVMQFKGV
ncbi:septum site-determining protein MinC [Cohnella endophytica]|uniref:Probable septum site-determining protein MinC n=1 Tax=Cohnella endophytica TaxID=2419778 RepID=A0A494XX14_9BACL|nr:septum site-determining protein MinC [Cohnella endophytica]RKP54244.1 septum site-determining protein MinC [Cohnella endophytica]